MMLFIDVVALIVVCLASLYLLALGVIALAVPSRASRFMLGFAGSQAVHFIELTIRLAVGAAFVVNAPKMLYAGIFNLFGWVLLVTTAGLLVVPWRWHQRFAERSVPQAIRYIALIGVCSIAFGGFILAAVILGRQ